MTYAEAKKLCADAFARASAPGMSASAVRQAVAELAARDSTLMEALVLVATMDRGQ